MKKRILSIILIAVMAMALMACGGNKDVSDNTSGEGGENRAEMFEEEENSIENVEEGLEDGYEIVDFINVDSGDTKLKFNKCEKYTLENGEEVVLVYLNFSNVSAEQTSIDAQYNFSAFQDGVEITVYSTIWDEFEEAQNRDKQILQGATIEVAIAIATDNWESPIKLRVDDEMLYDEGERICAFQQQELNLQ